LRPLTCAAVLVALAAPAPVRADEFIDRVNAAYKDIAPQKRSDLVLLAAVAKMQPPPASVSDIGKAMVLPKGASGWEAAEAWAKGETQKAVLDALAKVTKDESMAFGQPYGADALANSGTDGIALVQAGLYTDLGDPPMLAAARFLYLGSLEGVGSLVNVEATRLAGEGKVVDAIDLLTNWLYFSRQMADRRFFQECRWGVRSMIATLDRIRDVAYGDFRSANPTLKAEQITPILDRLKTDDGYLMGDRLAFPDANYIAAQQAVAMTFATKSGPGPNFGQTMARLATTKRPLRLFDEAARWDTAAKSHADTIDTTKRIDAVFGDWAARWRLSFFDRLNSNTPEYDQTSGTKFSLVKTIIPDMGVLFNDRQVLRTQLIGTRDALALVAYREAFGNFPPDVSSVRPRFLKALEPDPFNPDVRSDFPLMYFVPIRDQRFGEREEPRPHEMNVVTGQSGNFKVRIGQDQFILYSVGPDGRKDWAKDVSGEPARGAFGDLLIWPPVTSLLRQHLQETGQIK
jgi:hypothetical protein